MTGQEPAFLSGKKFIAQCTMKLELVCFCPAEDALELWGDINQAKFAVHKVVEHFSPRRSFSEVSLTVETYANVSLQTLDVKCLSQHTECSSAVQHILQLLNN